MDFSCPPPAFGAPPEDPFSTLFTLAGGLLLFAFAGAAIVSPLVRARYRRRVRRLMALDQVSPRPAGWWALAGFPPSPGDRSAVPAPPADAAALKARAMQAQRRVTRATLLAWVMFALCPIAFAGLIEPTSLGMRLVYAAAAALLALGPVLANLPDRWSRNALSLGALAGPAGATLLQATDLETASLGDIAIGAAILGAAYFAMLHRGLRGQVMPLFVAFGAGALVFFLPMVALDEYASSCDARAVNAAALAARRALGGTVLFPDANLPGPALLVAATTFGTLAVWLGFRALGGLIRLEERGWFSELSLASLLTLCLLALAMAFGMPSVAWEHARPIVAAVLLAWPAVTVGAYAWALGRPPAPAAAPQLLMLRVFAQQSRQHALLEQIQQRWRYFGPVHQIGGPDLVALNIDLHECSMFLAGRLHELFLPEAASDEQLRSRLRLGPDREGRFRVNEVFCFDTAWRSTVEQLMRESDVIVLDLRGFTRHREGTGYEVGLLAQRNLLPRVVAVRDAGTKWDEVEALVREAGADPDELASVGEGAGADAIFERLAAMAARSPNNAPAPA